MTPKRTSFRSPWQNGVAERCVGSCRRDLLDHVIVLNVQIVVAELPAPHRPPAIQFCGVIQTWAAR
jgi:hypothetical protein